jgi:hypothetical protein
VGLSVITLKEFVLLPEAKALLETCLGFSSTWGFFAGTSFFSSSTLFTLSFSLFSVPVAGD